MTDNMECMFNDIMSALFNCYPQDYIFFCFGDCYPIHPVMFGEYVMLEFVKHAYYENMEKHPLRYYLRYNTYDDHSERMRYSRTFQYTQKYKDINYDLLCDEANRDPEIIEKYNALLWKDMSNIANRIEGYELTEMDLFEHKTIQDLMIIKSVVEKRIYSSKKVSNEQFINMFEEYDNWVCDLIERSKKSNADLLFSTMAFFTLEWKYSLEFVYLVADHMEHNKIEEVDYYTIWALAKPLKYDSMIGVQIDTDNRMIKERQYLIPDFIIEGSADKMIELNRLRYIETVGLMALFHNNTSTEGGLYKDWFKDNTDLEDWASFMKEYDMFSVWHKKEWTNKKIRIARRLLKMISPFEEEMLNPDFRA